MMLLLPSADDGTQIFIIVMINYDLVCANYDPHEDLRSKLPTHYLHAKTESMFFNLFGGRKEEKAAHDFNDVTYISEQAKNDAVIKYAMQNNFAVFIAWFPETASNYKELFTQNGMDESRIVEARNYSSLKYPEKQIVFLEHYPLSEKEKEFVQQLSQRSFTVYNSLTEPLLWTFGGEKIVALMRRMGMKGDEPIAHAIVSKSIRRAQEKLASSITVEQSGTSQAEWFKRNFPDK